MSTTEDLKARVARVLAEEVAPALQMDGGDVELLDVSDGVAQVRLHGGCGGCPSSIQAGRPYPGLLQLSLGSHQVTDACDFQKLNGACGGSADSGCNLDRAPVGQDHAEHAHRQGRSKQVSEILRVLERIDHE